MKRRGFLGAIAASLAASKIAPTVVGEALKPKGTFLASGVVLYDYDHTGVSITRADAVTEHLGENGVLVGVSYPDGKTHLFTTSDEVVKRSLK